MDLTLHVWRQEHRDAPGALVRYEVRGVSEHMSFLEMLDGLNNDLILRGDTPIAFDSDCREGICGTCGMMVNGQAHGPERGTSVCQLHMRRFKSGDTIYVEPWRAAAFPVLRDLVVDRGAFERVAQAGGYISVNCGSAPDANTLPIAREDADRAFDAAACIACGACVAACPNASAMLYVAAKLSHLRALPQGAPEAPRRTLAMVHAMDEAGFGNCTNHYECEAACPKEISVEFIAEMNRAYGKAMFAYRKKR